MSAGSALILACGRSPVVPCGGALKGYSPHTLAAPVVRDVVRRAGLQLLDIDAVVVGNAMGAGGNPARMVALEAGLSDHCAALSVDTQCCSGLDAITLACGLIASGQASVVIAGGVEAWSRAPLRLHRPLQNGDTPVPYDRPAFAPDPARDPDLIWAAALHAAQQGYSRSEQDAYSVLSHQRALAHRADIQPELTAYAEVSADANPRAVDLRRAARYPALFPDLPPSAVDCGVSALGVSARADGAAFVVLATEEACARLQVRATWRWVAACTMGAAPEAPMLAAARAARCCMQRAGIEHISALDLIELHDAFAVQGLSFCRDLDCDPQRINLRGGGLARGHPIGASGAIALVRLLSDLKSGGALGMTAVAGAGGLGSAAIVETIAAKGVAHSE